ncbi:MAG: CRISPR-associated endonuclease Cas2 [Thermoguttaceae bacterium]|nr:CRISPR-associated endonuclease Cas2 [Thermoguttaceae bacterium]
MIIISYDISDNKKRTRFAKFLSKFGHRIQYSVFEIDNSSAVLDNVITEINNKFIKNFEQSDSVYLFKMSSSCIIQKFGYSANEDDSLIIIH